VDAQVGARERVVAWEHCLAIAAGKVDGAGVTGGRVAENVARGHREGEGAARRNWVRGRDQERAGRCRVDRNAALRAGDAGGRFVGGNQRLATARLKGSGEGVDALVGSAKGVVCR